MPSTPASPPSPGLLAQVEALLNTRAGNTVLVAVALAFLGRLGIDARDLFLPSPAVECPPCPAVPPAPPVAVPVEPVAAPALALPGDADAMGDDVSRIPPGE